MSLYGRFFGQYLCDRGVINRLQLEQALDLQKEVNTPLGVLAIELGYMRAEQVDRVLHLQQSRDERFGDIAVAEGFLSPEQLSDLLARQSHAHLRFGEALVRRDILGYQDLERLLAEFNLDNEHEAAAIRARLTSLRQGSLLELVIWTTQRLLARAIASQVKLHAVQSLCDELPPHALALSFSKDLGGRRFDYGLVLDRRPLLSLTWCLLRKHSMSETIVRGAVGEFAAAVDYAVCRGLTRAGRPISGSKPLILEAAPIHDTGSVTCVTLSAGLGEVHLYFSS